MLFIAQEEIYWSQWFLTADHTYEWLRTILGNHYRLSIQFNVENPGITHLSISRIVRFHFALANIFRYRILRFFAWLKKHGKNLFVWVIATGYSKVQYNKAFSFLMALQKQYLFLYYFNKKYIIPIVKKFHLDTSASLWQLGKREGEKNAHLGHFHLFNSFDILDLARYNLLWGI